MLSRQSVSSSIRLMSKYVNNIIYSTCNPCILFDFLPWFSNFVCLVSNYLVLDDTIFPLVFFFLRPSLSISCCSNDLTYLRFITSWFILLIYTSCFLLKCFSKISFLNYQFILVSLIQYPSLMFNAVGLINPVWFL